MAEEIAVIWVKREGKNFFGEDWTGKISLKLQENFFSTRIPARAGYVAIPALRSSARRAAPRPGHEESLQFRGTRSANFDVQLHIGESRDSESGPTDYPGMTTIPMLPTRLQFGFSALISSVLTQRSIRWPSGFFAIREMIICRLAA
jgi:hypothetical protein